MYIGFICCINPLSFIKHVYGLTCWINLVNKPLLKNSALAFLSKLSEESILKNVPTFELHNWVSFFRYFFLCWNPTICTFHKIFWMLCKLLTYSETSLWFFHIDLAMIYAQLFPMPDLNVFFFLRIQTYTNFENRHKSVS